MDCQAGASSAAKAAMRNMNTRSVPGVTRSNDTSAAKTAETTAIRTSSARMKRRLSMMSANAPAGRANRNIGKLLAT